MPTQISYDEKYAKMTRLVLTINEEGCETCDSCNRSQRYGSVAKLVLAIKEGRFAVASTEEKLEADFDSFMKGCHEEYPSRCCCYDDWGEKNPLNPDWGRTHTNETYEDLAPPKLTALIDCFVWRKRERKK